MFLLGAIVTVLIGIPASVYVTNRTNTTAMAHQQTLTNLQTFEATGGQLDEKVRAFSDALVDKKGIDATRSAMREAISVHSSAAFVMRNDLSFQYVPYMTKLRKLRNSADLASTPRQGVKVFQSLADLIALRQHAADRIRAGVIG